MQSARDTNVSIVRVSRASATERTICLRIRYDVFVTEQGYSAALEPNAWDDAALHYIAHRGDAAVGAARAIVDRQNASAKIGRVAVIKSARGTGVGLALMQAIIADEDLRNVHAFSLSAQMHAISFYEQLGFAVTGDVFEAAGAPHVLMRWTRNAID